MEFREFPISMSFFFLGDELEKFQNEELVKEFLKQTGYMNSKTLRG